MFPALIADGIPWWLAAPLLQLGLLLLGMALDETYVNRATVLTGSVALWTHALIAGEVGLFVGVYLDVGLALGVYGAYAYVVDGYVPPAFRLAAYFAYSPLSIFLVILVPDVLFPLAIVAAAAANVQLIRYLEPAVPYYFGPETAEEAYHFDEQDAEEGVDDPEGRESPSPSEGGQTPAGSPTPPGGAPTSPAAAGPSQPERGPQPAGEATPTAGSTERGILPGFMRRIS